MKETIISVQSDNEIFHHFAGSLLNIWGIKWPNTEKVDPKGWGKLCKIAELFEEINGRQGHTYKRDDIQQSVVDDYITYLEAELAKKKI